MYASSDAGRGTGLGLQLPDIDDPEVVRDLARRLSNDTAEIDETVAAIDVRWHVISDFYVAPEADQLTAATHLPRRIAHDVHAGGLTAHRALITFAAALDDLHARRTTLLENVARAANLWSQYHATSDDPRHLTPGYPGHTGGRTLKETAFMEAEEYTRTVSRRIANLREDLYLAELACANTLRGIHGAPRFHLAGRTTVDNPYQYGVDATTFLGAWRDGDLDSPPPGDWEHRTVGARLVSVARAAPANIALPLLDSVGLRGWGRFQATWSGVEQVLTHLFYWSPLKAEAALTSDQRAANVFMDQAIENIEEDIRRDPVTFFAELVTGAFLGGAGGRAVKTIGDVVTLPGSPVTGTVPRLSPTTALDPAATAGRLEPPGAVPRVTREDLADIAKDQATVPFEVLQDHAPQCATDEDDPLAGCELDLDPEIPVGAPPLSHLEVTRLPPARTSVLDPVPHRGVAAR